MLVGIVIVIKEDAAAIQAAFHEHGELAAATEVTQRFSAITGTREKTHDFAESWV